MEDKSGDAYDVVIVGGGIIGMSIAFHLGGSSKSVLVIDADHQGKATSAGAGIISGATTSSKDESLYQLVLQSSRYYPEFIQNVTEHTDLPTGYRKSDQVIAAFSEDQVPQFDAKCERIFRRQEQYSYPSDQTLKQVAPDKIVQKYHVQRPVSALVYSDAAQVDGEQLNAALVDASSNLGVDIISGMVSKLRMTNGVSSGVVLDGRAIQADSIVIAGGAWSINFANQLNLDLDLFPQRGQIIHFKYQKPPSKPVPIIIGLNDYYALSWGQGHVVVGATRESRSGFSPHNTVDGMMRVMEKGMEILPDLRTASYVETRVGLRPYSSDGLPYIGRVPSDDHVLIATGHGPLGLTAAPLTGYCISQVIQDKRCQFELHPFRPDR